MSRQQEKLLKKLEQQLYLCKQNLGDVVNIVFETGYNDVMERIEKKLQEYIPEARKSYDA